MNKTHSRLRSLLPLALALLLAVGAASAASAVSTSSFALGGEGELYRVVTGPESALFPGPGAGDHNVVALSIVRPNGRSELLLVPGTEGNETESSPSLVYEEASKTVFLIWESRSNYIHSQIRLASYSAEGWSEAIELPGELFSLKSSPSLAITRDTFITFDADGEIESHARTIYHALWWEEAAARERVVYSPVVLIDGTYVGWSSLFILNDLGFGDETGSSYPGTADLARSLTIRPGSSAGSVVLGMVDGVTRQLLQMEVSVIPGEMSALAAELARTLDEGGAGPVDAPGLADRARVQLIDVGARLRMHPALIEYLAEVTAGTIQAEAQLASPMPSPLADRARVQLIDVGARMIAQGLSSSPAEPQAWLLELASVQAPQSADDSMPMHSLRVEMKAMRSIPRTNPGAAHLFVSRSGQEALVAWQVGDTLFYTESQADDWSPVLRLRLGPGLDLATAYQILEQRTTNR